LTKEKIGQKPVVCDSSEPKSIAELKKYNIFAMGAKKGPDSVDYGIKFLQKHEIVIDIKCQNFKNEIQQYKWKEDKNGTVLPIPVDKFNHLLDALRYAYEDEMQMSDSIIFA
jgi:phage terminase large subunit